MGGFSGGREMLLKDPVYEPKWMRFHPPVTPLGPRTVRLRTAGQQGKNACRPVHRRMSRRAFSASERSCLSSQCKRSVRAGIAELALGPILPSAFAALTRYVRYRFLSFNVLTRTGIAGSAS